MVEYTDEELEMLCQFVAEVSRVREYHRMQNPHVRTAVHVITQDGTSSFFADTYHEPYLAVYPAWKRYVENNRHKVGTRICYELIRYGDIISEATLKRNSRELL